MASSRRLIMDNVLAEIRRMCGEQNTDGSITDELLLDCCNRAQKECEMLLGRYYPDSLITYTDTTTTYGTTEYDFPEDCAEGRIQMIEMREGQASPIPLQRSPYSENFMYESSSNTNTYPTNYMEMGYARQIRVLPQPKSGLTLRIWYIKELPELVLSQGKITDVNTGTGVLTLDALGSAITTSLDAEGSHLSIIDGQTGEMKGLVEVSALDTSARTVTIAGTPAVSTIDNVSVSSSLTSLGVADGDLVCVAPGSCICQVRAPVYNYMVQYAFALIQQVNGADAQTAYAALSRLEKFVKGMDQGKPSKLRVKLSSYAYQPRLPIRSILV